MYPRSSSDHVPRGSSGDKRSFAIETGGLENVDTPVLAVSDTGTILWANAAAEVLAECDALTGRELAELIPQLSGVGIGDFLSHAARGRHWLCGQYLDLLRRGVGVTPIGIRVNRIDVEQRDVYLLTLSDCSELVRAESALRRVQERTEVAFESVRDGVIITDAKGRVETLNPMAQRLTGWTTRSAQGRRIETVYRTLNERTREPLENPLVVSLSDGNEVVAAAPAVLTNHRTGAEFVVCATASPVHDANGRVTAGVLVFHDTSSEREVKLQLSHQARHDGLTGLLNRAAFWEMVGHLLSGDTTRHTLLYLDLDQFKLINETCGLAAGDQLLKDVASLLRQQVRVTDALSRLGDDEFAILLRNCDTQRGLEIANGLREEIRKQPFVWKEDVFEIGVSIGVAGSDTGVRSVAELLSAADIACDAARETGRNQVHLYSGDAEPSARQRDMQWVSRLTRACEEDRLEIYYQPIVPIGEDKQSSSHFELLLRLRNEDDSIVLPSVFIPAAERFNLMPTIDRWVVNRALEHLVYQGDGEHFYTLSINLSGISLSDEGFLDYVVRKLEEICPPEGSVCFEITETAAVNNLSRVARFMRTLKELGCLFSLDDFGSGLSSFVYLKSLPVDFLKIDGHFIRGVATNEIDYSFVSAIHQISQAMGIQTIAEHVEDADALDRLEEAGINYVQGYFLARPLPATSRLIFNTA